MDCSLPDSSIHGILEWVAISFSRRSSQPRDQTRVSCIVDRHFTIWATRKVLLIAIFRLKLKKVWKITRPFRYDLNQIPYDYTVEVRNRFKELDLIDRVLDELWNEVRDIVQEIGIKTIPMKKKCKKATWLSEEALQIALKRREAKSKWEKERY